MTGAELQRLADRVADEYTTLLDFARTVTALISALPVVYGVLTLVVGQPLWAGSPAYTAALRVPHAPQSWGMVFVVIGIGLLISEWRRSHLWMSVFTVATALVLGMFMVAFGTAVIEHGILGGLPPTVVYGILSLLFLARARLSWAAYRRKRRR
ncbi:hypothetical protein SEA_DEVONTE__18 [Mycobacterium phage Devonte]|nr:hypothetical protein SEA_DEVONTE__18 [Mycobacterium phage Devonte]